MVRPRCPPSRLSLGWLEEFMPTLGSRGMGGFGPAQLQSGVTREMMVEICDGP